MVFKRGTWKGLIGTIEKGGHILPPSIAGERDMWKNAQKNPKKNITSEKIKQSIPAFKSSWTLKVCDP